MNLNKFELKEEGANNSQTRPVTRFRVPKEAMPKKHLSPLKKIKQEVVDEENGEADVDLMPTEEDQGNWAWDIFVNCSVGVNRYISIWIYKG